MQPVPAASARRAEPTTTAIGCRRRKPLRDSPLLVPGGVGSASVSAGNSGSCTLLAGGFPCAPPPPLFFLLVGRDHTRCYSAASLTCARASGRGTSSVRPAKYFSIADLKVQALRRSGLWRAQPSRRSIRVSATRRPSFGRRSPDPSSPSRTGLRIFRPPPQRL